MKQKSNVSDEVVEGQFMTQEQYRIVGGIAVILSALIVAILWG